jgi:hypothetical protein
MLQASRRKPPKAGAASSRKTGVETGVKTGVKTGVTSAALIRSLARLGDTGVPDAGADFAERLSQWVGWTDAIALSAALDGAVVAPAVAGASHDQEATECRRMRDAWESAIQAPMAPGVDFAPYRQRYLSRQQMMEAGIGPIRARLRARLAETSPEAARLAAVDALMEQVLGPREQRLLSGVPALLQKHFERLQGQSEDWPQALGREMQELLLAELDIRFQPIEGLLEALRMRNHLS